jgi:hypothetical protein
MRFATVTAVGFLAVAFLIGCASEKQLPDAITVPPDDPKDSGPTIPKESEPDAKKIVARCLQAASGGDSAKLAKLRTFRLSLVGSTLLPSPQGTVVRMESTRHVEMAWPNRARLEDVLQSKVSVLSGVRWPSVWVQQQLPDGTWQPRHPNRIQERLFLSQYAANICFPFLNPLTDDKTIFYGWKTVASGDSTTDIIQAAIPDCPPFALHFDPKTGYLLRVVFAAEDGQQLISGVVGLSEYKSFDGILLPSRITYEHGGVSSEEWKVDKLEFVPTIDAARFDPPRDEK